MIFGSSNDLALWGFVIVVAAKAACEIAPAVDRKANEICHIRFGSFRRACFFPWRPWCFVHASVFPPCGKHEVSRWVATVIEVAMGIFVHTHELVAVKNGQFGLLDRSQSLWVVKASIDPPIAPDDEIRPSSGALDRRMVTVRELETIFHVLVIVDAITGFCKGEQWVP
jgi:hypothetical protein